MHAGLTRAQTWYIIRECTDSRGSLRQSLLVQLQERLRSSRRGQVIAAIAKQDVRECLELLRTQVAAKSIDLDFYLNASSNFTESTLSRLVQEHEVPLGRLQIVAIFDKLAVNGCLHREHV